MTFNLLAGPTGPAGSPEGIIKIATGTISAPVSYLDLTLPAGYASFTVEVSDFFFSAGDALSAALSFDAGSTWLNDATNYDSYIVVSQDLPWNEAALTTYATSVPYSYADALNSHWSQQDAAAQKHSTFGRFELFPGSASRLAAFIHLGAAGGTQTQYAATLRGLIRLGGCVVNPLATVVPTAARANKLRLQPYGNGDTPPTSAHTIVAGSYALWGILL